MSVYIRRLNRLREQYRDACRYAPNGKRARRLAALIADMEEYL